MSTNEPGDLESRAVSATGVTIFGSARAQAGTFGYEETKRTAAALAAMGCDIITGGGPGLMQAANEGAASSLAG